MCYPRVNASCYIRVIIFIIVLILCCHCGNVFFAVLPLWYFRFIIYYCVIFVLLLW